MGISIKGVSLPEGPDTMLKFAIFGDGKAMLIGKGWKNPETGKFEYRSTNPEKFFSAVNVPEFDPADNYWDFEDQFWDDGFAPATGV